MKVCVEGKKCEYRDGITYKEIAADFAKEADSAIVLALIDGCYLKELFKCAKPEENISFLTLSSTQGHKAYKRSACMLMIKAMHDVIGEEKIKRIKVEFSIDNGYYVSAVGDFIIDEALTKKITERMLEIVAADEKILKQSFTIDEAIEKFAGSYRDDKKKLLNYRLTNKVNLYSIGDYYDYYYGYMLPTTGYIKWFDLSPYDDGLMLKLPVRKKPEEGVGDFHDLPKIFEAMKTATEWNEMLDCTSVGDLNDIIGKGGFRDLVLLSEALQESRISEIAKDIVNRGGIRFVMIAGPSSSGKTSFSHRLSIQLRAHGLKPHPIPVDDYFVPREFTPKDEDGKLNYECLGAIDVELFNHDMTELMKGNEVELPTYNFITGLREYGKGKTLKLAEDEILVIEGIHCLNDKLSHSLPMDSKYKIYISALTTLNIDDHNRIPTTDARLLRRMVRDFRTRGASAQRTLDMWSSVRRGEDENIFPYQESADATFNSALIYELSVLKQFAEPVLYSVKKGEPQYLEAQRLLKFLSYFLGVTTEGLPNNSLVREFVGGSIFPV